ncbi:hypothetical protein CBOM_05090 [Ceraceosorus bombacis]|uniref:Uncharacterized protein n=1 Tax=Ceraceosorus bombacis TaxID=401625 RepID=A0A0P1BIC6_9BASI|nr:hypothetical protein CBOM_05090 [Ceraceosorus bombacis]
MALLFMLLALCALSSSLLGRPHPHARPERFVPKHGPSISHSPTDPGNPEPGTGGTESNPPGIRTGGHLQTKGGMRGSGEAGTFMRITSKTGLYGPNGHHLISNLDRIKLPPQMDIDQFTVFWMDRCFQMTPHGGGLVWANFCGVGKKTHIANFADVSCVRFGAERLSYTQEFIDDYSKSLGFSRPSDEEVTECLTVGEEYPS